MKNFVGSEESYKKLVDTILEVDDDAFPILLEHENPHEVTIEDIENFINKFKADTDLDVSIHINTCDCGQLHMTMIVDLDEETQYGNLHVVK